MNVSRTIHLFDLHQKIVKTPKNNCLSFYYLFKENNYKNNYYETFIIIQGYRKNLFETKERKANHNIKDVL